MTVTVPSGAHAPLSVDEIDRMAEGIRRRVFEHVLKNNGGYLSQALSSAQILAALYGGVLDLGPVDGSTTPGPFPGVPGPDNPAYESGGRFNGAHGPDRDRFIFSPAHYALVLYAALIEAGRLDDEALDDFNVDGSTLEMIGAEHSPGVETTTGSLAQALSQANGIALARKMRGEPGKTWVFMSDGELQEGQTWEAMAFAQFHGLSNLRAVVDANAQQCDGRVDDVGSVEPIAARIRAFGWTCHDIDGHDTTALVEAMTAPSERPAIVIARTNPAYSLPLFEERSPVLHYLRFGSDEERAKYEAAYAERTAV